MGQRDADRHDAGRTAVRDVDRALRLGASPRCQVCGETDSDVLIVDRHHVAGRANDPDAVVLLCRNDHARLTEALRRSRTPMVAPEHALTRLAALLDGLAELLILAARWLAGWSTWVELLANALDTSMPGWRDVAAAIADPKDLAPLWER